MNHHDLLCACDHFLRLVLIKINYLDASVPSAVFPWYDYSVPVSISVFESDDCVCVDSNIPSSSSSSSSKFTSKIKWNGFSLSKNSSKAVYVPVKSFVFLICNINSDHSARCEEFAAHFSFQHYSMTVNRYCSYLNGMTDFQPKTGCSLANFVMQISNSRWKRKRNKNDHCTVCYNVHSVHATHHTTGCQVDPFSSYLTHIL